MVSMFDHFNIGASEMSRPVYAIKWQLHDIDFPSDRRFRAIPLEIKYNPCLLHKKSRGHQKGLSA